MITRTINSHHSHYSEPITITITKKMKEKKRKIILASMRERRIPTSIMDKKARASAKERELSSNDSNPFLGDYLEFPSDLPEKAKWSRRFQIGREEFICAPLKSDEDEIDRVSSLLMRSTLAGFPNESTDMLKKYIKGTIDAFPFGSYLVCYLIGNEHEEEKTKKMVVVGVVGVSSTSETRKEFEKSLQFSDDAGYISDLVIEPRYRGRRIGIEIMLAAETLLRDMNRKECFIHVASKKNGLVKYYEEELGYVEVRSNFFRRDLLMKKDL